MSLPSPPYDDLCHAARAWRTRRQNQIVCRHGKRVPCGWDFCVRVSATQHTIIDIVSPKLDTRPRHGLISLVCVNGYIWLRQKQTNAIDFFVYKQWCTTDCGQRNADQQMVWCYSQTNLKIIHSGKSISLSSNVVECFMLCGIIGEGVISGVFQNFRIC